MHITRIVDLSVPLGPATVIYPGDPEPVFREHATIDGDGFNVLEVHMGSQTGTHVDAPRHFVSAGTPIDGLDLSRFMGTGVVIDVTGLAPRARITLEHIASALPLLGPGTIVLLQTGWEMHYETSLWFAHPFLDRAAQNHRREAEFLYPLQQAPRAMHHVMIRFHFLAPDAR